MKDFEKKRLITIAVAVVWAVLVIVLAIGVYLNTRIAELEDKVDAVQVETCEPEITAPSTEPSTEAETTAPETEATTEAAAVEPRGGSLETEAPETEAEPVETSEARQTTTHLGTFKLTAYCSCPICCGQWANGITATGTTAQAGRTIAVDPSVIPYGTKVQINGHTYVAEDTGGHIKGNRIDIFFNSHTAALEFGIQYADVYTTNS